MGNGAYCDMQTWGMVLIEPCRHGEWCLLRHADMGNGAY